MDKYLIDVRESINFPKSITDPSSDNCKIDCDQKFVWLTNRTTLQVFLLSNGSEIIRYNFNKSAENVQIIDVIQYKISSVKSLLLIGLRSQTNGSILVLFDIQKQKILREFRLRYKISKISKVDETLDSLIYPFQKFMKEPIFLGTDGGLIFIVDINLEFVYSTFFHDEIDYNLDYVSKSDILTKTIDPKNNHYAVIINESLVINSKLLFWTEDRTEKCEVDCGKVTVTALDYCEPMRSLLVGFNIGVWQIWSLETLTILYTSSHLASEQCPVAHFAFVEPIDDPRNFCYLWIVFSERQPIADNVTASGKCSAKAIFVSFLFETRIQVSRRQSIYRTIAGCAYRFRLDFDSNEPGASASDFAVCSHAKSLYRNVLDGDIVLCYFVWHRIRSVSDRRLQTNFTIFDLNQWYRDEMPNAIDLIAFRCLPRQRQPQQQQQLDRSTEHVFSTSRKPANFLWIIDDVAATIDNSSRPITDFTIDPSSINIFRQSLNRSEEFYHPSALSFEFSCLCGGSKNELVKMIHRGVQNSLLHHIKISNSDFLWNPQEIFNDCMNVGLITFQCDSMYDIEEMTIDTQRDCMLSLALEEQMIQFIVKCAKNWILGVYANFGCTFNRFLQWSHSQAMFLRDTAFDNLKIIISGPSMNMNACETYNQITAYRHQLSDLYQIYQQIAKQLTSALLQKDIDFFTEQSLVLKTLTSFFELIEFSIRYECLADIVMFFRRFANDFAKIRQSQPNKSFFIDKFMDEEFNSFIGNDERVSYPPKSFNGLIDIYLKPIDCISSKHLMFYYFLMDFVEDQKSNRSSLANDFALHFNLNEHEKSFMFGFWLLDRGQYGKAFAKFRNQFVKSNELPVWYHRFIIEELVNHNESKLALQYFKCVNIKFCELEDQCMIVSLFVAQGFVYDAHSYITNRKNDENCTQLLTHFYKECEKYQKTGDLIKIFIDREEEVILLNYALECTSKHLYIPYFIQRHQILDILEFRKKYAENKQNFYGSNRNKPLGLQMIENYLDNLPSSLRPFVDVYAANEKDFESKINEPIVPLSKIMNSNLIHSDYKSSFHYAYLLETTKLSVRTNSGAVRSSRKFVPFLSSPFPERKPSIRDRFAKCQAPNPKPKTSSNRKLIDYNTNFSIFDLLKVPKLEMRSDQKIASKRKSASAERTHRTSQRQRQRQRQQQQQPQLSQGILKTSNDSEVVSKELRFDLPDRHRTVSSESDNSTLNTSTIVNKIIDNSSSNASSDDSNVVIVINRKTSKLERNAVIQETVESRNTPSECEIAEALPVVIDEEEVEEEEEKVVEEEQEEREEKEVELDNSSSSDMDIELVEPKNISPHSQPQFLSVSPQRSPSLTLSQKVLRSSSRSSSSSPSSSSSASSSATSSSSSSAASSVLTVNSDLSTNEITNTYRKSNVSSVDMDMDTRSIPYKRSRLSRSSSQSTNASPRSSVSRYSPLTIDESETSIVDDGDRNDNESEIEMIVEPSPCHQQARQPRFSGNRSTVSPSSNSARSKSIESDDDNASSATSNQSGRRFSTRLREKSQRLSTTESSDDGSLPSYSRARTVSSSSGQTTAKSMSSPKPDNRCKSLEPQSNNDLKEFRIETRAQSLEREGKKQMPGPRRQRSTRDSSASSDSGSTSTHSSTSDVGKRKRKRKTVLKVKKVSNVLPTIKEDTEASGILYSSEQNSSDSDAGSQTAREIEREVTANDIYNDDSSINDDSMSSSFSLTNEVFASNRPKPKRRQTKSQPKPQPQPQSRRLSRSKSTTIDLSEESDRRESSVDSVDSTRPQQDILDESDSSIVSIASSTASRDSRGSRRSTRSSSLKALENMKNMK